MLRGSFWADSKAVFSVGGHVVSPHLHTVSVTLPSAASPAESHVSAPCAQMVLAILQHLAPTEPPPHPDTEQEKGFVSILQHTGFHGGSGTAVFVPTCAAVCCRSYQQPMRSCGSGLRQHKTAWQCCVFAHEQAVPAQCADQDSAQARTNMERAS